MKREGELNPRGLLSPLVKINDSYHIKDPILTAMHSKDYTARGLLSPPAEIKVDTWDVILGAGNIN